jgi:hypothetical protein
MEDRGKKIKPIVTCREKSGVHAMKILGEVEV